MNDIEDALLKLYNSDHLLNIINIYYTTDNQRHKRKAFDIINAYLEDYISVLTSKYALTLTEDLKQDIILHSIKRTLPYIYSRQSTIKNARAFIFISISNFIKSHLKHSKPIYYDDANNIIDDTVNDVDTNDTRVTILNLIDDKLKAQKIVNKSNSIFLLLLRDYIIKNDFDVRDFKSYVISKMNLTQGKYYSILSNLNIRGAVFSERCAVRGSDPHTPS